MSQEYWSYQTLSQLQLENQFHRNSWSASMANEQLKQFIDQGFPNRSNELWKYTSLQEIKTQKFEFHSDEPFEVDFIKDQIALSQIKDSICFVFFDGKLILEASDYSNLPKEVIVMDLIDAWRTQPLECQNFLENFHHKDAALDSSKEENLTFSLLNIALLSGGLYLSIPANLKIASPIHLLHFNSGKSNQKFQNLRHLIKIGESSQVKIIEEYASSKNVSYFTNVVTQIAISKKVNYQHFKLQRESSNAFHIEKTAINQQEYSESYFFYLGGGAKLSRDDLRANLSGEYAKIQLNGIYLPQQKQHIANYSFINHEEKHTQSDLNYRGILSDEGHGVFNGKVKVLPKAIKTEASQSNHNLLLSEKAIIDTKPELEIYTDDIKCSHGATIGQLDPNALFYLQSRGIKKEMAKNILVLGFAESFSETIIDPHIRNYFNTYLLNKIENTAIFA